MVMIFKIYDVSIKNCIRKTATVQNNCIIFFQECFEIPFFCKYMRVHIRAERIVNSGTQSFCVPCLLRLLVYACTTTVKKRAPRNTFFMNQMMNQIMYLKQALAISFLKHATLFSFREI